ncbi:MAG TPA: hypothetical protein PKL29_10415, partial [Methanothrix sp.]|nr:hypothetical protein [Methanothrix sp.]
MFYLGEYGENTAKDIKRYLDDAKIKAEFKPCLVIDEDTTYYFDDKISVIREALGTEDETIGRYIAAIKVILPQATAENFEDLYIEELYPDMAEKRAKILALATGSETSATAESSPESSEATKSIPESSTAAVESTPESSAAAESIPETSAAAVECIPESSIAEEEDSPEFDQDEWLEISWKTSRAITFAKMILSKNDLKPGEQVDGKLDDPIIEVIVDPEDYETKPDQLKCDIEFHLDKSITVFVDELTTPLAGDMKEEFWDEYPSEAQR